MISVMESKPRVLSRRLILIRRLFIVFLRASLELIRALQSERIFSERFWLSEIPYLTDLSSFFIS